MNTYTITNIRRTAASIGELARQLGLTGYPTLDEGSPTYGRAYRLNVIKQGSSRHGVPNRDFIGSRSWPGYLGMTKRETFERLIDLQNAFYDLADLAGIDIDYDAIDRVRDLAEQKRYVSWQLWTDTAPWKTTS